MLRNALGLKKRTNPLPAWPSQMAECGVIIAWLLIGFSELRHGSAHAGWVAGGAVMVTGQLWCARLVWRRWNKDQSSIVAILLISSLSNRVQSWTAWRAHKLEEQGLFYLQTGLTALLLILFIADLRIQHWKEKRGGYSEDIQFDPEGRL